MALLPVSDPVASAVRGVPFHGRVLGPLRTRTGELADPLTSFCFDAWLLCSHAQPGVDGLPDGRLWERAVAGVLTTAGFHHRQGPGQTTLLGFQSSSGVGHELDAVGRMLGRRTGLWDKTVILESKAVTTLPKTEIINFEAKVWDFYLARLAAEATASWHPLLVSAGSVATPLRMLCAQRAVVLIEPNRLPLPVLLWFAARPSADMKLPAALLSECVRLGHRAVATVQERWPVQPDGTIAFDPTWWTGTALPDLDYVHDELSAAVLDVYDTDAPGILELRADALVTRLRRFQ
jgi:hypothetical protein